MSFRRRLSDLIKKPDFWLLVIIFIGVVIRLITLYGPSFDTDLKFFQDWTDIAINHGIVNIYNGFDGKNLVDYPPIYLYILNILGLISKNIFSIDFNSSSYEYFIKFLNIFIDLGTSFFIFIIVRKLFNKKYAVISVLAYFLNPYIIYVSSVWGQVDNLISFFSLLGIYIYISKFKTLSFASIAIGVLTKLQTIVIAPILFLHFLFTDKIGKIIKSTVLALLVVILIVSPFLITENISKVINVYTNSTARYPYISMNAYNLWWMFANPDELYAVSSDTPLKDLQLSPVFKTASFPQNEILSTKYLAYLLFFLVYLILCLSVFLNRDYENLFLTMSIGILAFFTLNVQMHERYLFPFFATFVLIFFKKKRYILYFILLSILGWVNIMSVFSPNSIFTSLKNHTYPAISYVVSEGMIIILVLLVAEVIKGIWDKLHPKINVTGNSKKEYNSNTAK